ncbi:CBS domain-containing protein [Sphingorhabdus arenilitoris]|uniref:CBS domain-containing protein n=1 Tax=Sphingorhabdus arenilitoris TaxID=1490041 RepID=A0ABV8RIP4_9SPHN
MQIKDRPEFNRKGTVLTFSPEQDVFTAVQAMSEKNYGAAVVVSPDNKPLGIVTERDFMRRLINKGLDPKKTALSAIMTSDLRLARGDDDLLDWLRQMSNDRFRHLPVVDDDGTLIGIMSQGDFVSYTWPELLNRVKEQARATFDINPSIFIGLAVFVLIALTGIFALLLTR